MEKIRQGRIFKFKSKIIKKLGGIDVYKMMGSIRRTYRYQWLTDS